MIVIKPVADIKLVLSLVKGFNQGEIGSIVPLCEQIEAILGVTQLTNMPLTDSAILRDRYYFVCGLLPNDPQAEDRSLVAVLGKCALLNWRRFGPYVPLHYIT